ncbi:hypothetical protein NicSoilB4_17140 [Arthrobacter sp. NicSoilB4]|nr:hypothetical protein NicSoilB4_17140 [Arthrobacter sp. NicSoilB4]
MLPARRATPRRGISLARVTSLAPETSRHYQRIQHDVNVLLNHPTLSRDPILEQAGRGLLGIGFSIPAF